MNFTKEQEENMLAIYITYENYYRRLRQPLLSAFDIYKSNINYGLETETEEEHLEIMNWYSRLLNLEIDTLLNVPTKIQRYI